MSILGVGKGLLKIGEGVINGEGEKILQGIYGTATSAVGVVVKNVINEEIGNAISEHGEQATDD